MHASLSAQRADEIGAVGRLFLADEALEEAVLAVGEPDGLQFGLGHAGFLVVLLHHGGQLLVVTDEDKLVDVARRPAAHRRSSTVCRGDGGAVAGQQTDDGRLENL